MAANGRLLTDNTVLNQGTDDELRCYGYEENSTKKVVFYMLVVLTFGLILLLLYWKPEIECYMTKSRCSLYRADMVLLEDSFGKKYVCPIKSFNAEEEMLNLTDAYNRDCYSHPENIDTSINATLTIEQKEPVVGYFDNQYVRYVWSDLAKSYTKLLDLSSNTKCHDLLHQYQGLNTRQQAEKRVLYGENTIEVEVKSYWKLFIEEVLNPFYIFQIASIILWSLDEYYYYAACIFIISCVSIAVSLYETKRQMITLHDMVSTAHTSVSVARGDGHYENLPITDLVPGDVIAIPGIGCTMACDAVLVAGTCIVNESMLTGESIPVTKTQMSTQEEGEIFSPEAHKRHTLFAGTRVVQTRYYGSSKVLAVVVRTGFSTAKGELVRAILFPKPLGFKFYQDAMRFIMFLGVVALFGMGYSVIQYVRMKVNVDRILLRVLDIITIIVPPALPAAMTVGTVYAQNRLKKKQIYCISPPRINFCGRLNLFCFDKTGTLTEDGLDMFGVIPVDNHEFGHVIREPSEMSRGEFMVGMTTCHSLTIIDGEIMGDPLDLIMFNSTKWVLDEPGKDTSKFDTIMPTVVRPVTKEMFMPDEDLGMSHFEVGIVRQFTFTSAMQRMSVITRTLGKKNMDVYCKGAPEKIVTLCDPSTVPDTFSEELHQYTVQGFRVIALAWRPLDPRITWHHAQKLPRDKVECNLIFLGLIVLQNKLKRQTKPVIKTLLGANIRCVMVTGDMIKTAVSVARNCGMVGVKDHVVIVNAKGPDKDDGARIEWEMAETPTLESPEHSDFDNEETHFLTPLLEEDKSMVYSGVSYTSAGQLARTVSLGEPGVRTHLAVSGKSFSVISSHFPHLLPKICVTGTIFARMLPDQKCHLIEKLQDLGYTVGMCGDGANDCEALKAAHAGISLSEAEASVAAPFTSRVNNIECVVSLMREGRAALVTSFGCFKYMALYSFIQFISVMILYTFGVNLGDMQFLYIDLAITTTIAIFMGNTHAYHKLVARRPEGSLVKPSNMLSILLQVLCAAIFQIMAIVYLINQSWYTRVVSTGKRVQCWESTIVFLVSAFQYITIAFCYSRGPPFRKRIYTNIPFTVSMVLLVAFTSCFFMLPWKPLLSFFELMRLDQKTITFRGFIILIVAGHFLTALVLEYLLTENKAVKRFVHSCIKRCRKKQPATKYKMLQKEMDDSDWPPVGEVTYASYNRHDVNGDHTAVVIEHIPLGSSVS